MSRKKLLINTVSVSVGCNCRKSTISSIFHPKRKPKTFDDTTTTATSSSQFSEIEPDMKNSRPVRSFGRIGSEGLAVEKDSDDPYLDFRHSMLQMILENEIYSKDELRELLRCFLQLNSPCHHGIIVRAFTEIWNGVYSVKNASVNRRSGYKSREN